MRPSTPTAEAIRLADASDRWTVIASALAAGFDTLPEVSAEVARALWWSTALWQRDRRGDPAAAEAAFLRALDRDPGSVELLSALAEVQRPQPEVPVDPQDLEQALQHPDSHRRFAVLESADELVEMLNAPLEKWRVFLHPSQAALVKRNFNGPARVLGGAGTGKTVVAMHRARHLAANVFSSSTDRILFTTYTRNLAQNIRTNLELSLIHISEPTRPY